MREARFMAAKPSIHSAGGFSCLKINWAFFPNGIKEIGDQSFLQCNRLRKIYIPVSCQKIGQDAFGDCPGIIIHGKPGTVAEDYAKAHSLSFVADE